MDDETRIEILNDLKAGDVIRLRADPEFDENEELDVTFVAYEPEYDMLTVSTEADGLLEVDGNQFKEVIWRTK